MVHDEPIEFNDIIRGRQLFYLHSLCGDFVIKRADGVFAYQFAVVIDDNLQGVNQVVRGADLLTSTPRQILLQKLLGYDLPEYAHLPLVTSRDGHKLSKRDNLVTMHRLKGFHGRGVDLIFLCLKFLGQNPPLPDNFDSPVELLDWGAEHFDCKAVPTAFSAFPEPDLL
jgi:glutamyl-Q tRNA(Asp) synthetase